MDKRLENLHRALHPRAVAVVGARKMDDYMWLRNMSTFTGPVYSVNIDPNEIPGIEALGFTNYARLTDIPAPVDLVICAVPRRAAPIVLRDAIAKGVAASEEASQKLLLIKKKEEEILGNAQRGAFAKVSVAEKDAKTRGNEILEEANKKVEGVVSGAKRLIQEEKTKMGDEVYRNARELVRLGMGKILGNIPSETRDNVLIDEALKELKHII